MRIILSLLVGMTVGCGTTSEPAPSVATPSASADQTDAASEKPAGSAGASSPDPAPEKAKSETAAKARVETGPLPPGEPMVDFPKVSIVGFGLRFELNPPFQAARMSGMYQSESEEVLIVSWWDVGHEAAGQHGRLGLYNVGIIPAPKPADAAALRAFTEEGRKGTEHRLQVGETGSIVRLPDNYSALGGMGVISMGPADAEWRVEVGDAPSVAFPRDHFLHSWDPADGGPIHFDKMPRQPYGAWPVRTPVVPEPGSAAP